MEAVCKKDRWRVYGWCECGQMLQRHYRNIPGKGSYREMGLFCSEHGVKVTERVVHYIGQNGVII